MMHTEEFSRRVEACRQRRPAWFDLPADRPADHAALDRVETDLGVALPSDFRWFLTSMGGGAFAFVVIYSADAASDFLITSNQPDLDVSFVAISDDGTGNWIGFPVVEGVCEDRVVMLEHESGEIRQTRHAGFLDFVANVGLRIEDWSEGDRQAAEPQFYDIVRIGDGAQALELVGAEGVVLGLSEDEDTGEKWFAVQVGDRPLVMLPLADLTPTGRSVPPGSVYSGDHLRVSRTGRILGDDSGRPPTN